MPDAYHLPVMSDEVLELFRPLRRGIIVDATFGGGGHSRRLKEELGSEMTVIGIDRDPAAQAEGAVLDVEVLAGNFADIESLLDRAGIDSVTGVLFDFGVSSRQLDDPSRGFSYHHDGPLDMRMDPTQPLTAADLVNALGVEELADLLREYGEERHSRRIAQAIVAHRPLERTTELAAVVAEAVPAAARRHGHPARKTFQALRIAVNEELSSIREGLDGALARLEVGGRCVTIAYHSLEDRLIKQRFADGARGCVCPPDLPVCGCGADPELRLLTRGAMRPRISEVAANPRSRSARLRACERTRR